MHLSHAYGHATFDNNSEVYSIIGLSIYTTCLAVVRIKLFLNCKQKGWSCTN